MLVEITEQDQRTMEKIASEHLFDWENYDEVEQMTRQQCEQLAMEIVIQILRYLLEKKE